jgi:LCP family protein required for cell wall assembly
MLSIPRDLVVPIAGTGAENRINAALTGGPGELVKTIEQNFDIPIHHYVLIDFDGFQAIVDALGGIDVRFPYPSRDSSRPGRREAGCRHLNGVRALALARSRYFSYQVDGVWHSDPWADLGRIRRQQAFLQASSRRPSTRA